MFCSLRRRIGGPEFYNVLQNSSDRVHSSPRGPSHGNVASITSENGITRRRNAPAVLAVSVTFPRNRSPFDTYRSPADTHTMRTRIVFTLAMAVALVCSVAYAEEWVLLTKTPDDHPTEIFIDLSKMFDLVCSFKDPRPEQTPPEVK